MGWTLGLSDVQLDVLVALRTACAVFEKSEDCTTDYETAEHSKNDHEIN